MRTNFDTSELEATIAYAGPAGSGKATSVAWIFDMLGLRRDKAPIVDWPTHHKYIHFVPPAVGTVDGRPIRVLLHAITGDWPAAEQFAPVTKHVDGIIFVADSRASRLADNVEARDALDRHLKGVGFDPASVPRVFVYNKRDLVDVELSSVEELNAALNPQDAPFFEGTANKGHGVFAAVKECLRAALVKHRARKND